VKKDDEVPLSGHGIWNPHRASRRRSLILCGTGAVLGLLIAGFGLFTARGTRTAHVPPEDAALVNNVPILMADLVDQLRTLNVSLSQASQQQKKNVLDAMIREELYVQRGVEIGLPTDDIDVRSALVAATEGQVAADAMTELPATQRLRAWYDNHRDRYASQGFMELHEFIIPLAQAPRANEVVAALRRGATPASLDLKSSGRVDDGREFYFAANDHLGDQLFAIARSLHDGDVSAPVVQQDGAHILVMKANQTPIPTNYEDARAQVLSDYLSDQVAQLQARNERFLRKRADIKIAPGLL
jgi:hypothetical protein